VEDRKGGVWNGPGGSVHLGRNFRLFRGRPYSGGRAERGGSWEDNTYEFGVVRQAPPMDRSRRNGIRTAFYPDPGAVPEVWFRSLTYAEPADPRSKPPVPEDIFRVYQEQFAYAETPLNAEVETRRESPGEWILEEVSFDAAYGGERIKAYLFLPTNTPPPYQTVVYFPGSAWAPMFDLLGTPAEDKRLIAWLDKYLGPVGG
jgi:hypothetical protein